jgi:hypothetical protein
MDLNNIADQIATMDSRMQAIAVCAGGAAVLGIACMALLIRLSQRLSDQEECLDYVAVTGELRARATRDCLVRLNEGVQTLHDSAEKHERMLRHMAKMRAAKAAKAKTAKKPKAAPKLKVKAA